MKCLIIQTDGYFSDDTLQYWSDVFAEMINKNEVLVLPGNFHLVTIVNDDERSNIVVAGDEQNNDNMQMRKDK